MGHLVVICHENVIEEVKNGGYPVEYLDKGLGVKFARSMHLGLGGDSVFRGGSCV